MAEKTLKQNEHKQHDPKPDELSPDEIDALFQAARGSSPSASRSEARTQVLPYDFSSSAQISADQMHAISIMNDLFARNLTRNWAALLHKRFQVTLRSAGQIQFQEFLSRMQEMGYVTSMRLEPLGVPSLLQLDLGLVPPLIDLLLGGDGDEAKNGPFRDPARTSVLDPVRDPKRGPIPDLTEIEESILGSVVEIVCRELSVAWQPAGLSFTLDRRQTQTELVRMIPLTENTLCLTFEVRMPKSSGLLNLAFPTVVANTMQRRITTGPTSDSATGPSTVRTIGFVLSPRHTGATRSRIAALARRIRFGCTLQLRSVRVAARALEELKPGDVLRLNVAAETLPEWQVGGLPLLEARAMRHGMHRAARIERSIAGGGA